MASSAPSSPTRVPRRPRPLTGVRPSRRAAQHPNPPSRHARRTSRFDRRPRAMPIRHAHQRQFPRQARRRTSRGHSCRVDPNRLRWRTHSSTRSRSEPNTASCGVARRVNSRSKSASRSVPCRPSNDASRHAQISTSRRHPRRGCSHPRGSAPSVRHHRASPPVFGRQRPPRLRVRPEPARRRLLERGRSRRTVEQERPRRRPTARAARFSVRVASRFRHRRVVHCDR
jgi:hypothetical protein